MRTKNKDVPPGMSRCSRCKIIKTIDQFRELKTATDGRDSWCRSCRRTESNPQRKSIRYSIQEYKRERGCQICGERDPRVLDFHHPGKKEFSISNALANGNNAETIWKEIKVCIVICSNCHRKHHGKIYEKP